MHGPRKLTGMMHTSEISRLKNDHIADVPRGRLTAVLSISDIV